MSAAPPHCDKPGCDSCPTYLYLVGPDGFQAYYCSEHAPGRTDDMVVLSHHVVVFDSGEDFIAALEREAKSGL